MRKLFSLLFILVTSSVAQASANFDLGSPTGATPYDTYMSPVKDVLHHLSGEETSIERVRQLMRIGRNFRYSFTTPYVAALPSETAATHAGDCKAKALWLADQLNDSNVRFVIGKARSDSRISHAWLMWQHDARWWVLDCTNLREPIPADSLSRNEYIPFYSFSKNGEYRHQATTSLVAENTTSRSNAPVASRKSEK